MKVMSLHLGHNATVALAEGGDILGVLSQEKCDNIKNSSIFPKDAIEYLCTEVGWQIGDIQKVLIASNDVFPPQAYEYLYDSKNRIKNSSALLGFVKNIRDGRLGRLFPYPFKLLRKVRVKNLISEGKTLLGKELAALKLGDVPVEHVEHHLCHARAALHSFTGSQLKEPSLIFTLDGSGDGLCATVTKADTDGTWTRSAQTTANA